MKIYHSSRRYFKDQREILGSVLGIIGVVLILGDTTTYFTPRQFDEDGTPIEVNISWFNRIFKGDLVSLVGSAAASLVFVKNVEPVDRDFPTFTSLIISSTAGCTILALIALFFEGCSLSMDEIYGIFGLFSSR